MKSKTLARLGWREWVSLPDLGIDRIGVVHDDDGFGTDLKSFFVVTPSRLVLAQGFVSSTYVV